MTEKAAMNEPSLSEDPTLSELFDFIAVDEGMRVLPVTVRQSHDDTRLLIALQGEHDQCSFLMAKLMSLIGDLHDLEAQAEQDDEPRIVHPG